MSMMQSTQLDSRIGVLNSGLFYAFANGYDKQETVGTLAAVERALGLRESPAARVARPLKDWTVVMRFEYPAWDEVDGIVYQDITASAGHLYSMRVSKGINQICTI